MDRGVPSYRNQWLKNGRSTRQKVGAHRARQIVVDDNCGTDFDSAYHYGECEQIFCSILGIYVELPTTMMITI